MRFRLSPRMQEHQINMKKNIRKTVRALAEGKLQDAKLFAGEAKKDQTWLQAYIEWRRAIR